MMVEEHALEMMLKCNKGNVACVAQSWVHDMLGV